MQERDYQMMLNIGCGKVRLDGYINVDIHGGDVIGDIRNLPFDENSFDGALASHVLEHILELRTAMHEIHRVLKPNSILTIRVPYGLSGLFVPFHMRAFDLSTFKQFTDDDDRSLEYGELFSIESQYISDYHIPFYWHLRKYGLIPERNIYPIWKRKEITCLLKILK